MIRVNAMGDACPIPVVKTRNAIRGLKGAGVVEVLVDNEIAVQNLCKMAAHKGYGVVSEQLEEAKYRVIVTVGECTEEECLPEGKEEKTAASSDSVVVISSDQMGEGDRELGKVLMRSFLYALSQQEELPGTLLFYNGGARLTCEGSLALEDLKNLEESGSRIFTCGTCLDFYGLKEKLMIGEVTNMYEIAGLMTKADRIVKP